MYVAVNSSKPICCKILKGYKYEKSWREKEGPRQSRYFINSNFYLIYCECWYILRVLKSTQCWWSTHVSSPIVRKYSDLSSFQYYFCSKTSDSSRGWRRHLPCCLCSLCSWAVVSNVSPGALLRAVRGCYPTCSDLPYLTFVSFFQ